MSEQQRQIHRNDNLRNASRDSKLGLHNNCCRMHANNSFEHEMGKAKLTYDTVKKNHWAFTELQYGRAILDNYDADIGEASEIMQSETIEQLLKKIEKYPSELYPIRVYRPKTVIVELEEINLGDLY